MDKDELLTALAGQVYALTEAVGMLVARLPPEDRQAIRLKVSEMPGNLTVPRAWSPLFHTGNFPVAVRIGIIGILDAPAWQYPAAPR